MNESWLCTICTYINKPEHLTCDACGHTKGVRAAAIPREAVMAPEIEEIFYANDGAYSNFDALYGHDSCSVCKSTFGLFNPFQTCDKCGKHMCFKCFVQEKTGPVLCTTCHHKTSAPRHSTHTRNKTVELANEATRMLKEKQAAAAALKDKQAHQRQQSIDTLKESTRLLKEKMEAAKASKPSVLDSPTAHNRELEAAAAALGSVVMHVKQATQPSKNPNAIQRWTCEACEYSNQAKARACFCCGIPKPKNAVHHMPNFTTRLATTPMLPTAVGRYMYPRQAIAPPKTLLGKRRGTVIKTPSIANWYCGKCLEINSKSAMVCIKCSSPPTTFTYTHWACPTCTFTNQHTDRSCVMCNAPKPTTQDELVAAEQIARSQVGLAGHTKVVTQELVKLEVLREKRHTEEWEPWPNEDEEEAKAAAETSDSKEAASDAQPEKTEGASKPIPADKRRSKVLPREAQVGQVINSTYHREVIKGVVKASGGSKIGSDMPYHKRSASSSAHSRHHSRSRTKSGDINPNDVFSGVTPPATIPEEGHDSFPDAAPVTQPPADENKDVEEEEEEEHPHTEIHKVEVVLTYHSLRPAENLEQKAGEESAPAMKETPEEDQPKPVSTEGDQKAFEEAEKHAQALLDDWDTLHEGENLIEDESHEDHGYDHIAEEGQEEDSTAEPTPTQTPAAEEGKKEEATAEEGKKEEESTAEEGKKEEATAEPTTAPADPALDAAQDTPEVAQEAAKDTPEVANAPTEAKENTPEVAKEAIATTTDTPEVAQDGAVAAKDTPKLAKETQEVAAPADLLAEAQKAPADLPGAQTDEAEDAKKDMPEVPPDAAKDKPEVAQDATAAAKDTPEVAKDTQEVAAPATEAKVNTPEVAKEATAEKEVTPEVAKEAAETAKDTAEVAQAATEASEDPPKDTPEVAKDTASDKAGSATNAPETTPTVETMEQDASTPLTPLQKKSILLGSSDPDGEGKRRTVLLVTHEDIIVEEANSPETDARIKTAVEVEAAPDAEQATGADATTTTGVTATPPALQSAPAEKSLVWVHGDKKTEVKLESKPSVGHTAAHEDAFQKDLLALLNGNNARLKAFKVASQRYGMGKTPAYAYYFLLGKTFGDDKIPLVLPNLLKALAGKPKQQEALRNYHYFIITRQCQRCNKIVYLPEQEIAAGLLWHRACFACEADGCGVALSSDTVELDSNKIYCSQHRPNTQAST